MAKHALFGTSSWGLGHATRDLVLMRALLEAGCRLTVVATGMALYVLSNELGTRCRYLDWPDMPTSVAKTSAGFYAKTVKNIPQILGAWVADKRRLNQALTDQHIDIVISDHRYGLITSKRPCYFISHSPRYIAPWRDWFMETVMEGFMSRWLKPACKVLIPDDEMDGLSGDMSHRTRFFPEDKLVYMGILSSLKRQEASQDVDVFISISGPEPQRTQLQETVLNQLPTLAGRIVIALGSPHVDVPDMSERVEIYPYLDRAQQERMMNCSRLMVCRSGYTTLMELAELGKRALLIPTPGQSEQLYLARTLRQQGLFYSVKQSELDLATDIPKASTYPGYRPAHPTTDSVRCFLETVLS